MRKRPVSRALLGSLAACSLSIVAGAVPLAGAQAAAELSPSVGTVAGVPFAYCDANIMEVPEPPDPDGGFPPSINNGTYYNPYLQPDIWSDMIPLEFSPVFLTDSGGLPLSFDGIYVSDNGTVYFNDNGLNGDPPTFMGFTDMWQTMKDVADGYANGARGWGFSYAAPFLADVDLEKGGQISWGASPDGSSVCVQWADVEAAKDGVSGTNTFQLLLIDRSSETGRDVGDFDIVYNYDQIGWDESEVMNWTSAPNGQEEDTWGIAAYSNQTFEPGTFMALPGSAVQGALLDSGPQALI
ncbi:MAG: hypothetical protein LBH48_03770, partial [Bifidobacteriaceae bacterium]|nr:hypothetical protein [Bifidobacteriaceae bacterium]